LPVGTQSLPRGGTLLNRQASQEAGRFESPPSSTHDGASASTTRHRRNAMPRPGRRERTRAKWCTSKLKSHKPRRRGVTRLAPLLESCLRAANLSITKAGYLRSRSPGAHRASGRAHRSARNDPRPLRCGSWRAAAATPATGRGRQAP